jgi:hypothetical protein
VKPAVAVVMVTLAVAVAACSKPQQPKVELATPLDTARGLQQDVLKKSEDRGAAADQIAK